MFRRICKWVIFKWLYPALYHIGCCRRFHTDRILLVENHAEQLSDNFTLLYDCLKQKEYDVKVHYLRIASSGWGSIIFRTCSMIWDMAVARCVFISESNSVFGAFKLRKGTKLVQLWHACGAFKKWGYSVAEKSFGDDKKELDTFCGHRNYDLVPVSGKAVCWAYEEAFGLENRPGIIKPLGVSRTDAYFSEERRKEAFKHLRQFGFPIKDRKIILYAPTFRGDIEHAKAPDQLDLHILSRLKEQYVFMIKNHPFVKERMVIPKQYQDFCVEVTDELSIEDLLITADICVTDYSSIVFEYSLLQKPILFFAYDLEDYYDERGFYYPYESFVPGPIVKSTEGLVSELGRIEQFDRKKLSDFCKQYMGGCDGHSTKRILEYVLEETF